MTTASARPGSPASDPQVPAVPFATAVRAWVRVAVSSFGGPAGQIAVMHRLLVEERRWFDERRFLHALSYCMLLPGPEAQQLATYLGWLLHGTRGGLVAGTLFVLPGFVSILGLSIGYALYHDAMVVQGLFYGLKPAVLVIIVGALVRIGRRALHGPPAVGIAAAAFVALFLFQAPFPLVVLAAGAAGATLERRRPGSLLPLTAEAAPLRSGRPAPWRIARMIVVWLGLWALPFVVMLPLLGSDHVLVREAVFFSKAAVVTFGGAYAVLAYIAQQAVDVFGWLSPREMLDGLGLAETTPGPLIMVVQFVAFLGAYRSPGGLDPLVAGVLGSVVTTWVTFVPCFLFIFAGAPYVEYLRGRRTINAALAGITAAVVGVILNLALWFGLHALFGSVREVHAGPLRILGPDPGTIDPVAILLAVLAGVAMFRYRLGMLATLAAAAVLGAVHWILAR